MSIFNLYKGNMWIQLTCLSTFTTKHLIRCPATRHIYIVEKMSERCNMDTGKLSLYRQGCMRRKTRRDSRPNNITGLSIFSLRLYMYNKGRKNHLSDSFQLLSLFQPDPPRPLWNNRENGWKNNVDTHFPWNMGVKILYVQYRSSILLTHRAYMYS